MKTGFKIGRQRGRKQQAFSLLEVMIAIGMFFMAVFAILGLVSSSLANARRLQRPMVDAGTVVSWFSLTNQIVEGSTSGDMSQFLGKGYQEYTWVYASSERESNKLFQVDFKVYGPGPGKPVVSEISALFFSPSSPAGSLDGSTQR